MNGNLTGSTGHYVRVRREFVPPEAGAIAGAVSAAASRIRTLAGDLAFVGTSLDPTWEGHSKLLFFDAFSPEPGNTYSLADWLDAKANQIRHMTVVVWETEWVETPSPAHP
jgi:uncharacterized protein YukE